MFIFKEKEKREVEESSLHTQRRRRGTAARTQSFGRVDENKPLDKKEKEKGTCTFSRTPNVHCRGGEEGSSVFSRRESAPVVEKLVSLLSNQKAILDRRHQTTVLISLEVSGVLEGMRGREASVSTRSAGKEGSRHPSAENGHKRKACPFLGTERKRKHTGRT